MEKAPTKASPAPATLRILGLDPGSRFTGYGVIDRQGSRLSVVAQGRIALPRGMDLPKRLRHLHDQLLELHAEHQPKAAVLESLYHGVNPRSLIVLAQARGALLAALAGLELPIHEYSPAEIKTAVAGHGRADKTQVARMVRLILGLRGEKLTNDASDALAAAVCFAQRLRLDRLEGHGKIGGKELSSCI